MPADIAELFDAARAAQARAYVPYSRFKVGAAVRGASGRIYAGCNVENAAYPVGNCAEASALAAMVMAGETRLIAALVVGDGALLCTPCGGCRQRLREFGALDTPVHVAGPEGLRRSFTIDALLPASFGPDNLGPTR
jgi:cytidine deaminase